MKLTHIPTSTLKFIKDLQKNNNRDWFNEHKPRYQKEIELFKNFANTLNDEMSKIDNIERCKTHRIYRDTRFSKDKTPYKKHLSGGLTRATARLRGGYYFHIEPGNSFAAGGFWAPNSADLKRIREEIAIDDKPLRKILKSASFKKMFGTLEGSTLKTAPRGFEKDHPAVDLLRYKQFVVYRKFTDKEIKDPKFVKEVVKTYKAMHPFFNYMSEVLTTDLNGVSIVD
ncbi:MAG: DUF2461 domain-containing protein [Saprospiraceae bacterium]